MGARVQRAIDRFLVKYFALRLNAGDSRILKAVISAYKYRHEYALLLGRVRRKRCSLEKIDKRYLTKELCRQAVVARQTIYDVAPKNDQEMYIAAIACANMKVENVPDEFQNRELYFICLKIRMIGFVDIPEEFRDCDLANIALRHTPWWDESAVADRERGEIKAFLEKFED